MTAIPAPALTRDGVALMAYLESRMGWAFGYGPEPLTQDCARFVGGGVKAARGVNPLDAFSSQWTTRRGARRVLAAHGGMARAVGEVMRPIPPTMAARGDVGLTADSTLVLVEGEMVVGLHPERGQVRLPRTAMTSAWSL
ncbi:DUF6950 family protein [Brevundimonas subvibrioides]|uniref:DUF6950 domain-containing protein n=1 Tax=Brevundimonas subvibrioides (strain ATCC 15264 / DSM 4735 / LMG 14903 / NBRC 16000 / CB 81) TaxID=633149 RepID=D9QI79_BRESC|nr:hypothetical protein [Brevundimonas subvibrioides]ADK99381.1 hypothetical protein Bresu_0067 [Brevundimonas subvibrioides ATCC 15264]